MATLILCNRSLFGGAGGRATCVVNMLFWQRYYLLWLDFYTAPTHSEAAHKEKLIQVFADRFYGSNVTQTSGGENNTLSWMAAHAESLDMNSRHSCDSCREVLLSGIPGFHAASGKVIWYCERAIATLGTGRQQLTVTFLSIYKFSVMNWWSNDTSSPNPEGLIDAVLLCGQV